MRMILARRELAAAWRYRSSFFQFLARHMCAFPFATCGRGDRRVGKEERTEDFEKIHGVILRVFIGDGVVLLFTCTGFQQNWVAWCGWGCYSQEVTNEPRRWRRGKELVLGLSDSLIYLGECCFVCTHVAKASTL